MNHKIQRVFEPIHATEELKQNMTAFVRQEAVKRKHKTSIPVKYAALCSMVIVLFTCGIGGFYIYQTPVSYISIDVNPSVELALNRFDRVVTVATYNEDGTAVLENLDLKNKSYTEAVELLLADETFVSYLSEEARLSFTVVSGKEEALLSGIKQCRGYDDTNADLSGANMELMEMAHHNGISIGKYQAFLELSQYDTTITAQDCQHMSMRELRDRISQYDDDQSDTQEPGSGHGNGNHNGRGRGDGNGCRNR